MTVTRIAALVGVVTLAGTGGLSAADRAQGLARLSHFSHAGAAAALADRSLGEQSMPATARASESPEDAATSSTLAEASHADGDGGRCRRRPRLRWADQFGTSTFTAVGALAYDGKHLYAFGDTDGELPGTKGAGGADMFLRKYDRRGRIVWTRQFGTEGEDFGSFTIAVHDGAIYVGGSVAGELPGQTSAGSHDAFVRKYSADGRELWTRQFGNETFDDVHGVAVHHGRVFVVGSTEAALPGQSYAGGPLDGFVRAYRENGDELWTRQFGTEGFDHPVAIAAADDAVYVGGVTDGAFPGQSPAGFFDAFLRKYDRRGRLQWTRQFGTELFDDIFSIAADDEAVFVHGHTEGALPGQANVGQLDAFVRKYSPSGRVRWTRQYGTPGWDNVGGIALDDDKLYLGSLPAGPDDGSGFPPPDAMLASYDTRGRPGFTIQFGTEGFDGAQAVAAGRNGRIAVGGFAGGPLFGDFSGGFIDGFVVELREACWD